MSSCSCAVIGSFDKRRTAISSATRIAASGDIIPTPLLSGNRVEGKSKKLAGRRGVVLLVSKESRMRSYKVQWDSGVVESVSARSIRREVRVAAWTPPDLAQIARLEEGDAGADVADSSSDMSISSSSSEGESV
ncbi:hypothetical protein L917_08843 [Phytophthora nicotianae]|uniref:Uncharacterized protein n=1 Tax=Phytophthora nicotianae TaxID=4792 RepID=W2L7Y5_PHYNI|nr:hypothetical protein L917_08843 [Phytophthora nicotianae]